jgi:ATP-dependent Lon protease
MIPEENVKDLQDIPENVKNHLEIVPVRWIDRVLEVALETVPQPLPEDDSPKPVEAVAPAAAPASAPDLLTH